MYQKMNNQNLIVNDFYIFMYHCTTMHTWHVMYMYVCNNVHDMCTTVLCTHISSSVVKREKQCYCYIYLLFRRSKQRYLLGIFSSWRRHSQKSINKTIELGWLFSSVSLSCCCSLHLQNVVLVFTPASNCPTLFRANAMPNCHCCNGSNPSNPFCPCILCTRSTHPFLLNTTWCWVHWPRSIVVPLSPRMILGNHYYYSSIVLTNSIRDRKQHILGGRMHLSWPPWHKCLRFVGQWQEILSVYMFDFLK